ncbi:MAG: gamma-glutamylcyclotransferase family protein [Bacteroidota bacterium]
MGGNLKLFVYGTLMSGFDNQFALQLHKTVVNIKKAWITGELFVVTDWHFPYPVAAYQPEGTTKIFGELLEIDKAKGEILEMIDRYEGIDHKQPTLGEYIRQNILINTHNGEEYGWAYINNRSLIELRKITSGNFRMYLKNIK